MNWFSTACAVNDPKPRPERNPAKIGFWLGFAACGVACALAILKPVLGLGLIGMVAGIAVIVYLLVTILSGTVGPAILTWVLIFPLGYYFLSFPREKSIVTLDRVLVIVLLLAAGFASQRMSDPLPPPLRRCAIAWIIFLVSAAASLTHASNLLVSGKLLIDAFCLPALLGLCVLRTFDTRRYATALHTAACVMAFYAMCIGVAEEIVKEDLLPLPGSGIGFAGSLTRPNGPFSTPDSLALIGAITFFLLLFLRSTMKEPLPLWRSLLHGTGVLASLGMALMPMFRAVYIGLLVPLLVETWTTRNARRKMAGLALLMICAITVVLVSVFAPDTFEDRSQPGNIYSRMAQQRQTLQVFLAHPFLGVGLGRFTETVQGDSRYLASYQGIEAPESPHNNLGQIATETGLLGFVPYVIAQIYLVITFREASKRQSRDSQIVWKGFLYLFLCCFIQGMTASSSFNADVNLWYIFAISIFYKYYMTEPLAPPLFDLHERGKREYSYVPA